MIPVILLILVAAWMAWPFLTSRRSEETAMDGPPRQAATAAEAAPVATAEADTGNSTVKPWEEREQLCPHCSRLNPPHGKRCVNCGKHLLAENLVEAMGGDYDVTRELGETGIILALALTAVFTAPWMSPNVRIMVIITVVALAAYRFVYRMRAGHVQ